MLVVLLLLFLLLPRWASAVAARLSVGTGPVVIYLAVAGCSLVPWRAAAAGSIRSSRPRVGTVECSHLAALRNYGDARGSGGHRIQVNLEQRHSGSWGRTGVQETHWLSCMIRASNLCRTC